MSSFSSGLDSNSEPMLEFSCVDTTFTSTQSYIRSGINKLNLSMCPRGSLYPSNSSDELLQKYINGGLGVF